MNAIFDEIRKKYPYNFAFKILEGEEYYKDILPFRLDDCLKDTCTEREVRVVYLYFVEQIGSYKKVGEEICVGPERVRQILQKIYRKMRHPNRAKLWIAEEPEKVRKLKEDLEAYKAFSEARKEVESNPVIIHDLELSVRSYNCLARKGMTNLKDFDGLDLVNLLCIRNLGRKSAMEIVNHLVSYGFALKNKENDQYVAYSPYLGPKEFITPLPESFEKYRLEWPKVKEV